MKRMTQDTPEPVVEMVEAFRQKFTSFKKGRGPTGEGSGHVLSPNVWAHEATDFLTIHATTLYNDAMRVDENTSDGYHTFKELYEFRKLYNAALFNEWARQGKYNVHKSKRHSDGEECFGGGWFVVQATLPTAQITNHYELTDWAMFACDERERADTWDGHTAKDVAKRLTDFLTPPTDNPTNV